MNQDNFQGKTKMISGAAEYYWGKLLSFRWSEVKGLSKLALGYAQDKFGDSKLAATRIRKLGEAKIKRSQS